MYDDYIEDIRFLDEPDYAFLKKPFRDLMKKEGYDYDFKFDWLNLNPKKC